MKFGAITCWLLLEVGSAFAGKEPNLKENKYIKEQEITNNNKKPFDLTNYTDKTPFIDGFSNDDIKIKAPVKSNNQNNNSKPKDDSINILTQNMVKNDKIKKFIKSNL